ncbi:hypothetical protein F945_02597 [Acinetobacter rudis CIP 110305]|uniref:Uncharacterized protein n=1 Tax=Acinetobacter rudis CIP 110305 TaxID=421052 RepID=S3MUY2_9GAMM|nr:hypothetical protein F945_02597 [Acinetobacter rudis CIP 110305]
MVGSIYYLARYYFDVQTPASNGCCVKDLSFLMMLDLIFSPFPKRNGRLSINLMA